MRIKLNHLTPLLAAGAAAVAIAAAPTAAAEETAPAPCASHPATFRLTTPRPCSTRLSIPTLAACCFTTAAPTDRPDRLRAGEQGS